MSQEMGDVTLAEILTMKRQINKNLLISQLTMWSTLPVGL